MSRPVIKPCKTWGKITFLNLWNPQLPKLSAASSRDGFISSNDEKRGMIKYGKKNKILAKTIPVTEYKSSDMGNFNPMIFYI